MQEVTQYGSVFSGDLTKAHTIKAMELTLVGKSPSVMLQRADYQTVPHHTQERYDWLYVHSVLGVQSVQSVLQPFLHEMASN
jgi:hypothetical protein